MILGLRIPIGFLIASTATALAWAGERPLPTEDSVVQPALPQYFLDPNFLNYGDLKTDFSGSDRNFAAPKSTPSREKGVGVDLKTEYEVNVEKFLPQDGFPLYGPIANGNQQNGGAQKKKPLFFGLSVSKPLN
jgi:hypothetical protein